MGTVFEDGDSEIGGELVSFGGFSASLGVDIGEAIGLFAKGDVVAFVCRCLARCCAHALLSPGLPPRSVGIVALTKGDVLISFVEVAAAAVEEVSSYRASPSRVGLLESGIGEFMISAARAKACLASASSSALA